MRISTLRAAVVAIGLALAGNAPLSLAQAKGVCAGTYSTTSMHPLPRQAAVSLGSLSSSQSRLAVPFLAGMRDAGAGISDTGHALLQVAVTFARATGQGAAGQDGADFYRRYGWVDESWMEDVDAPLPSPKGLRISMAAIVTNTDADQISWVALIDCTVTTDDPKLLMFTIGKLLGRSLGRTVQQSRF